MRIGIFSGDGDVATLLETARRAEADGFDSFWLPQIFGVDALCAHTLIASQVPRIELGTAVTCPLFHYHPALVAQMAATTDRLSNGRLMLGVGTGEALNERPLGFPFPGYAERQSRMQESLEIMHSLLRGEKLTFHGEYYTTETAKLYSPPTGKLPILMAAGGPKSAQFAGTHADGLITSVKDPADTVAKVIAPYRQAATAAGKEHLVLATRWTVLAGDNETAWEALSSMRGLRAPGRLEATDPQELRIKADDMDRSEVLASYTVIPGAAGLIDAYRPLVTDVGADIVSIQVMSADPMATIELIGKEVLPELRKLAA